MSEALRTSLVAIATWFSRPIMMRSAPGVGNRVSGSELEDHTAIAGRDAALIGRAVEIAVRGADQTGHRIRAIGDILLAAEAVNDRLFPLPAGLRHELVNGPTI